MGNFLCQIFSESIKVLQEYNIARLCQNTNKNKKNTTSALRQEEAVA